MADDSEDGSSQTKSDRRYGMQPSKRYTTKEDKEREDIMKKLGMSHDDLMGELQKKVRQMDTASKLKESPVKP